jgi:hypothetical protein
MIDHLDEDGQPCTRHAPPVVDTLLGLAMVGSRTPAFHHDTASKLQSLVMAIDEIGEIADVMQNPDLQRASATALTALRDLHGMFNANRALSRPPQATRVSIGELIGRAAERAGLVIHGDIPADAVEVNVAAMTHAFAVLFDLAAGVVKLGRLLDLTRTPAEGFVELRIRPPEGATHAPPRTTELLTVATFVIRRDRGELRCTKDDGFIIRLPTV